MSEALVSEAISTLLKTNPPDTTSTEEFLGAQFDLGLAWVHFPVGRGGLDVSPRLQRTVTETIRGAGGPSAYAQNPIGYGMGAPTVATHGSEPNKDRWLRPLFTAEEVWCQLFSEPGAGSDVASLATTAVRDGDEWILNGQKVWTTLAHVARWGMVVARTDPSAPKHAGMTYFIVDMRAPGVDVRPLRQMTGEAEFNEIFLTEVRVPDAHRLDEVGAGWRVALTTLMNERVSIGGTTPQQGTGAIAQLMNVYAKSPRRNPANLDRVMKLWIDAEVWRLTNIRAGQQRAMGTPGPEGSVGKTMQADLYQAVFEAAVDMLGPEGMLYGTYEMRRPLPTESSLVHGDPTRVFLRSRANSIEGGTSEIMRNILGERVLGLPGEPRVDKNVAWSEVPRN